MHHRTSVSRGSHFEGIKRVVRHESYRLSAGTTLRSLLLASARTSIVIQHMTKAEINHQQPHNRKQLNRPLQVCRLRSIRQFKVVEHLKLIRAVSFSEPHNAGVIIVYLAEPRCNECKEIFVVLVDGRNQHRTLFVKVKQGLEFW